MKNIKSFDEYEHLNEDQDEDFGENEVNEYSVPKKVKKWFKKWGIDDYRAALDDLHKIKYDIVKSDRWNPDPEMEMP